MQMHDFVRLSCALAGAVALFSTVPSQAQSASATIPSSCSQNGTTVTCTTTTTFTIPSTVNLVSQTSGSSFSYTAASGINCTTLSASPSIVTAPSSLVNLTANCTGSYAYFWNGSTSPSSVNTLQVQTPSSTSAYPATYTAVVCPAGSTTTSASCTTLSTQVAYSSGTTVPSGCSISPASQILGQGTSVTLTASCTGGSPATSYTWTRASVAFGGNTASITDTPFPTGSTTQTVVYTVVASNSAGNSQAASATMTQASSVVNYCTDTYPDHEMVDTSYAQWVDLQMIGSKIYTVKLNVSASQNTTGASTLPAIAFGEASGAQIAFKQATISRNPCDFTSTAQTMATFSQTTTRLVSLNDPNRFGAGIMKLATGVWYLNIRNLDCQGVCATRIEIPTPGLR